MSQAEPVGVIHKGPRQVQTLEFPPEGSGSLFASSMVGPRDSAPAISVDRFPFSHPSGSRYPHMDQSPSGTGRGQTFYEPPCQAKWAFLLRFRHEKSCVDDLTMKIS